MKCFLIVLSYLLLLLSRAGAQTPQGKAVRSSGAPFVAPDGTRIAFISTRGGKEDLFVISPDGGGELQLTDTPESESIAGWSADGTRLIYGVFAHDSSDVYAVGRDGTNRRLLCRLPGRSPMISPDGSHILTMAGTWRATRLLLTAMDSLRPRQITDGSSIAWNTHWSPDMKRIAFTSRTDSASELAVYVMDADGSHRRQLTHVAADEGGAQWPVWSPDGGRLAMQVNSRVRKKTAHIWVADARTGDAVELAPHSAAYLDETPSWFPDGKRIAYQSDRTGTMEIWVMNADGSGAVQLTR